MKYIKDYLRKGDVFDFTDDEVDAQYEVIDIIYRDNSAFSIKAKCIAVYKDDSDDELGDVLYFAKEVMYNIVSRVERKSHLPEWW